MLFSKGLITAKNRVLVNFEQTLEEAEIEDGEFLTDLVLRPQLAATRDAFALWCHGDNEVVTWGRPCSGGDSSAVQRQLRGVQQIQSTNGVSGLNLLHTYEAFAAILADGSVVTWGDACCGGESSAVRDQLKGVQQIQAAGEAFAAVREDCGGDSLAIERQVCSSWLELPLGLVGGSKKYSYKRSS